MRHPRAWTLALAALPFLSPTGCAGPRVAVVRPPAAQAFDHPRLDPTEAAARVVMEHNQIRLAQKLPTLTVSAKLEAAARAHAEEMARREKMTHDGADGSTPFDRIERAGYLHRRAAENVAYGQFTVDQVMDGWMKSPGHKRNILGSFTQIGSACANGADGRTYWCVTFGTPRR